jgi:DNA-directed RNA polymerase beta subunit
MASYSIIDLSINVKTSTALKWIAPIGTKVKSKDNIVTLYKAIRLDAINETLTKELGNVFGSDLADYTVEDHLKVPNNIDEAVVSDVLIQEMKNPIIQRGRKKPDYAFARTSQKVIEEYEKEKDRKVIYERYPEYIASDTLDPVVMDPTEFKIVYTIRIRLIKKQTVVVGSKITSRYGGKGVVSAVKPDETMPIMVDKKTGKQTRVEVIMNPYSTVNRKIAGVLYELNLGNIAHKIYDLVEEYKKTKTGQKKIKPLLEKYYPGRYDSMSVEEFIRLHNSSKMEDVYYFNVGCYSSFTPEKIDKWMEELDLESQSEILMPENELTDLDELKENLSEEEYKKIVDKMKGKFIPVKKNLQCGYMTLEQLYHIPSYSNKVTSSLFGTDVNPKKDDPIMGRGKYRLTGQKIGEMELAVLLSRNAKPFIQGARRETAREDNQIFLNNLLGLGLTVTGEKGYYQGGSSQKDTLEKMKAKFRLKSIK